MTYQIKAYAGFLLSNEKVVLTKNLELNFVPSEGMIFSINDIDYEIQSMRYDLDEGSFVISFRYKHLEEEERYIIDDLKAKGWEG